MTDDTSQTGATDRAQVGTDEPYEVSAFAKKHGLTQTVARELMAEIGNDRKKLDAAAKARATPSGSSAKGGSTKATTRGRKKTSAGKPAVNANSIRRSLSPEGSIETAVAAAAPALDAMAEPLKAAGRVVRRKVAAAAKPLKDRVQPAAASVGERAGTVLASARRTSASARKRVAALPAAIGKRADKAIGTTKTAARSRTAAVLGAAAAGMVAGLAVNLGRKAVVQAPSVMAGDWFEAMKLEHEMALGLFDAIEATADTEPAKRTMLLVQLTHALAKHAFAEENVIYPALREWGDKADADKLTHDHGYVKQHLYDLDAIDPATTAFLAKIAIFRADLEAHIREEEAGVFPSLHAALGDVKNAAVTALANKEGFKLA